MSAWIGELIDLLAQELFNENRHGAHAGALLFSVPPSPRNHIHPAALLRLLHEFLTNFLLFFNGTEESVCRGKCSAGKLFDNVEELFFRLGVQVIDDIVKQNNVVDDLNTQPKEQLFDIVEQFPCRTLSVSNTSCISGSFTLQKIRYGEIAFNEVVYGKITDKQS